MKKIEKTPKGNGAKCVHCGEIVEDWEPQYCCSGEVCGCYGLPIYPPEHGICPMEKLKTIEK